MEEKKTTQLPQIQLKFRLPQNPSLDLVLRSETPFILKAAVARTQMFTSSPPKRWTRILVRDATGGGGQKELRVGARVPARQRC